MFNGEPCFLLRRQSRRRRPRSVISIIGCAPAFPWCIALVLCSYTSTLIPDATRQWFTQLSARHPRESSRSSETSQQANLRVRIGSRFGGSTDWYFEAARSALGSPMLQDGSNGPWRDVSVRSQVL